MAIDSGRDINNSINGAGALAVDAAGVNGLKRAAHQNPNSPEAIKGVAKQFEAMFLNMMMKSMRQATPQDGPFDSEQSKMFTTMLDQQMSQSLAQRGVGLADVLTRQLTPGLGKPPADPGQDAESAGMTSLPFGADRLRQDKQQDDGAGAFGAALPVNKKLMAADREVGVAGQRHARPAHVEAFHDKLRADAEEASKTTGIPARFMIAQAALESGWGKHVIANKDGSSSHNLFGIKATAGWKGKVVEATTTEYIHGVARRKVEKFRAYDSYADSFKDYASQMRKNPRYEQVLASAQDMNGFANGLQRAGYATDPRYAEKLTRIIRQS
jgi:flagellar protein FlgJ